MASAAGLMNDGSSRLFTNGARSGATVRPPLQAGDMYVVKSPAYIAAVGTNAVALSGICLVVVP